VRVWRSRIVAYSVLFVGNENASRGCTARNPSHQHPKSSRILFGSDDKMDSNDNKIITDPNAIGGGAINERQRLFATEHPSSSQENNASRFDPSSVRGHLYHALEGLHRYPNYLSRWSEADMEKLEVALHEQLAKVQEQRSSIHQRRNEITRVVEALLQNDARWKNLTKRPRNWQDIHDRGILHPDASKAIFGSRMWNKNSSMDDVLTGRCNVELDVGNLTVLMDEEFPDIYTLPLLSPEFCNELRDYVQALARERPDLLGRRVVNLDTIGLSWLNDLLLNVIAKPISRHLFAGTETAGADLDWRNGYVAGYSAQPAVVDATSRERLVTHTDDSEVTLNVGLGEEGFRGGLLEFRGLRGSDDQADLLGTYQPVIGKAVLHSGRHFHDVTQVTAGNRFALILWARSWQGIRSQSCPCCWLNGRTTKSGSPCICGAQWN
jgi:hypothetical protein